MKKASRIALAVLLIPGLVELVRAATIASGQFIQQTDAAKVGGTAVTTGAGASTAGTQRVILASDSPAGNVTNAGTFAVQADHVKIGGVTTAVGAGASNTGTQRVILASDSPAGNVTNTGTFAVQSAATLAAETTKVIGTVNVAAAQTIAVTNTGTFAVQSANTVSVPTIAKVAATTTSGQLIAANATRKAGPEIDCDCANTDGVAVKFGAAAAVYASDKQMSPCSNFVPPAGVVIQTAIQIIANAGTQNCRVIEYP